MREPIIVEVYETRRLLKKVWRWRVLMANGRKAGHEYNNKASAIKNAQTPFESTTPKLLRVRYLDGTVIDMGRIS